ncbi:DEAD/DEAH box helicase family protein [Candidatus Gracilibacteria bacterium]|nr:DEAD/DEAH box helicase family protein [Candidatus Gracilibacteria bacterium]
MLTLKFDANQGYQKTAIDSIVDIFEGQALRHSKFTAVTNKESIFGVTTELGYGNKLDLTEEDLLTNVRFVQDRNKLKRSVKINDDLYGVPNFAIEMETGTGKTYVYTRTVLELNKKYGFTKFIIVVPGVAIREGVHKSLQVTEKHFASLYPGQGFHYFVYNSSNLNQVQSFATSSDIEVMIINIDAFRKSFEDEDGEATGNIIHKPNDKLSGRRPIEFIQQTNPFVIIDEPQSVDTTDKSKEAIKSLNPLAIFRYSATHRESYNLMYRLGPVEAYENKLVKAIEVLSVSDGGGNGPYLKLKKVMNKNGSYSAKIELKKINERGIAVVSEETVNSSKKNSLLSLSNDNEVYRNFVVTSISVNPGNEYVEFENGTILKVEEDTADIENKRAQIRFTIETHLDKEMYLLEKGIKVISLFFIDKVHNYREYIETESGTVPQKGIYATIFEEEYKRMIALPKYQTLFNTKQHKDYVLNTNVEDIHDGYFAQDKNGVFKDSKEKSTKADESAFELIMKNKERLLSFDTNLRFIFSHSALKEGWDNPNVFQICTLVDTQDTMTKRQKIGRGLRLPVNQEGERIQEDSINILTVVANESYETFAETLQKEIESETNTKFGVINERLFEHVLVKKGEELLDLGYDDSKKIRDYLLEKKFIDVKGKVTVLLTEAIEEETFVLPEEYKDITKEVVQKIKETVKRLPIFKKVKEQKTLNKQVFLSPDFTALWDRIKYKTIFKLDFNIDDLVTNTILEIKHMEEIKANPVIAKFVNLHFGADGVTTSDPNRIRTYVKENYKDNNLPNIISFIEQYTRLKRSTISKILIASERLDEFYVNPQEFMSKVVDIINQQKRLLMVDGIKYEKIGDGSIHAQELFKDDELVGYITSNSIAVDKSVYSHVTYDSDIEKTFAEKLNNDRDVKLFVKLPSWFKIDTPLGSYNPDWAVVLDKNGEEKLYFVVETKGSILSENLRYIEDSKIKCGAKHFEAINTGIKFERADDYNVWRMGK